MMSTGSVDGARVTRGESKQSRGWTAPSSARPAQIAIAAALLAVGCLASGTAACAQQRSASEAGLPRYWLKVGQELDYSTTKEFTTKDGHQVETESNWQIWVVGQNDDGSWRLALRHVLRTIPPADSKEPQEQGLSERVTVAAFDLFPDGRTRLDPSLAYRIEPAMIFLRLPKTRKEAEEGWEETEPTTQVRHRYRLAPQQAQDDESDLVVIEAVRESVIDEIFASSSKSTFTFDRERGLVQSVATQDEQSYLIEGKGVAETELSEVEKFKLDWCQQLDAEVALYLAADQEYQKLMRQAERDGDNTDVWLVRAEHLLHTAAEKVMLPIVKEQFQQQLADHKTMAAIVSRHARDRVDIIGQPSPVWSASDLSGRRHSLKDYRGKVVVLDFWHRSCGWCMRTMPQVKQLSEQFLGRPVVVLGMNTDRDPKDAQFVVGKLKLPYPIVRAEALPAKYMIPGFPTLLIIDQKGVIRDMYIGYSPSLGKDASAVVESLLEGESEGKRTSE